VQGRLALKLIMKNPTITKLVKAIGEEEHALSHHRILIELCIKHF